MNWQRYLSNYSLARRAMLVTVVTLMVMILVAGLALAYFFIQAQVEHSQSGALTQANVASSTVTAAVRFGGQEVIADSLRAFDTGRGHDSAAVYDRKGDLVAQIVAPGESRFPPKLDAVDAVAEGFAQARAIIYPLRDDVAAQGESRVLGTLVVNPNQATLRASFTQLLLVVATVLGVAAIVGVLIAQRMTRALLRPVERLTEWADNIVLTGSATTAVAAPRGGAIEVDRLTNSFETLVAQVAEQNRELKRRQYELKEYNAHLESIAFSDSLTGLPNRPMFESTLASAIDQANATGRPLAVLFIDLDQLKMINDQHGHAQGDAALRATAARIRRALRRSDFVARLAGDEFVVISQDISSAEEATKLGERLTVWLGIALPEDQWTQPVRASIGVAVFPDHGADVQSLVHAADQAMYRAKALPEDESIRVACAAAVVGRPLAPKPGSNVITMSAQGRKTQVKP